MESKTFVKKPLGGIKMITNILIGGTKLMSTMGISTVIGSAFKVFTPADLPKVYKVASTIGAITVSGAVSLKANEYVDEVVEDCKELIKEVKETKKVKKTREEIKKEGEELIAKWYPKKAKDKYQKEIMSQKFQKEQVVAHF